MSTTRVHVGSLSRLRPTVNFANRLAADPGQRWGPRVIPDSQLLYIISGKASLVLGSETFEAQAGDCLFYGSKSPHQIISSEQEPVTFSSIHFEWDKSTADPEHPGPRIYSCSRKELSQPPLTYTIQVDHYGNVSMPHIISFPNIESLFLHIVREYRTQDYGYAIHIRGLLTQLLVTIIRHHVNGQYSSTARRKIHPALEAIRKQPHIEWRTPILSELCGYHPTYFATLFREATGYSTKHYLTLQRIRKAKRLIVELDTINEVALELGYTSVHYFCRSFKKITGLTPTEYKKRSIEL